MTRCMKRGGKVWITIFPDKPITKKPAETRMGSGKRATPRPGSRSSSRSHHVPRLTASTRPQAKEALRLAINQLPIKCKIVNKETEGQGVNESNRDS